MEIFEFRINYMIICKQKFSETNVNIFPYFEKIKHPIFINQDRVYKEKKKAWLTIIQTNTYL